MSLVWHVPSYMRECIDGVVAFVLSRLDRFAARQAVPCHHCSDTWVYWLHFTIFHAVVPLILADIATQHVTEPGLGPFVRGECVGPL
jgi:hypothetical protein